MPPTVQIERDAERRARELVGALKAHRGEDVSLGTVRVFLEGVDDSLRAWVAATPTDDATRAELRALTLRNSLPAFVSASNHNVPATATALLSAWVDAARTLRVRVPAVRIRRETQRIEPPSLNALVAFETGIVEYILCAVTASVDAAGLIRRLMAHLQISYDELGRMVGANGETVRRWEQGRHTPPPDKQAVLTSADAALSRLLTMLKADALPAAIRRPAEAFGNQLALDWILQGRIADVADRYDRALRYQG